MFFAGKDVEMRQKRADVRDRSRTFLDDCTNENAVMRVEISQQYRRTEQEVVVFGHAIGARGADGSRDE